MTDAIEKKPTPGEDIHQYLRDIRTYPRLTAEEERQLAQRCAQADEEAIRQMVNSNLRLVVSVAREYAGRGVPLLDLIQEGSIGLLVAARKFDYTLSYRFSTYATKWIRQGVTKCLLNHAGVIRVPAHTLERIRKIESVRTQLRQQTGEEPDAEQIALHSAIPIEKVTELLQLSPEVCSLDVPTGDGEKNTLVDVLEDMEALQPQEALVRQELEDILHQLLATLPDRQAKVLRLHFGMEDGRVHSLEEIGTILGISKERTRQIERQAMEKLQSMGSSLGLEDFLE